MYINIHRDWILDLDLDLHLDLHVHFLTWLQQSSHHLISSPSYGLPHDPHADFSDFMLSLHSFSSISPYIPNKAHILGLSWSRGIRCIRFSHSQLSLISYILSSCNWVISIWKLGESMKEAYLVQRLDKRDYWTRQRLETNLR